MNRARVSSAAASSALAARASRTWAASRAAWIVVGREKERRKRRERE